MQAKKETIDRAIENGQLPAIDRLLSGAHLLTEIADYFTEEADDRARACGMMLGEVKRMQKRYGETHKAYYTLWKELVDSSHMEKRRTEDFDHFMPYVARLLTLDELVTDTNTGQLVSDVYDGLYAMKARPKDLDFRVMRSDLEENLDYHASRLSEELKEALGEAVKVTFMCHEKLNEFVTAYAAKKGRTRRDIINEALVRWVARHPFDAGEKEEGA